MAEINSKKNNVSLAFFSPQWYLIKLRVAAKSKNDFERILAITLLGLIQGLPPLCPLAAFLPVVGGRTVDDFQVHGWQAKSERGQSCLRLDFALHRSEKDRLPESLCRSPCNSNLEAHPVINPFCVTWALPASLWPHWSNLLDRVLPGYLGSFSAIWVCRLVTPRCFCRTYSARRTLPTIGGCLDLSTLKTGKHWKRSYVPRRRS